MKERDHVQAIRAASAALRQLLSTTDQAAWSDRLLEPERLSDDDLAAAARQLLSLFEPPDNLDDVVLSYEGQTFVVHDQRRWQTNLRFGATRSILYDEALTLWLATQPALRSPLPKNPEPHKLVDYGYGSQVWRVGETFVARRDVGSLLSRWRDDVITEDEAAQAALGPTHFRRLCAKLDARLARNGLDPQEGTPAPEQPPRRQQT